MRHVHRGGGPSILEPGNRSTLVDRLAGKVTCCQQPNALIQLVLFAKGRIGIGERRLRLESPAFTLDHHTTLGDFQDATEGMAPIFQDAGG